MSDDEHTFKYLVGTLIEDMGKLAIITRVLASGALKTDVSAIKWRNNYEISYNDGDIQIIAESTFNRLIQKGSIKILSKQS